MRCATVPLILLVWLAMPASNAAPEIDPLPEVGVHLFVRSSLPDRDQFIIIGPLAKELENAGASIHSAPWSDPGDYEIHVDVRVYANPQTHHSVATIRWEVCFKDSHRRLLPVWQSSEDFLDGPTQVMSNTLRRYMKRCGPKLAKAIRVHEMWRQESRDESFSRFFERFMRRS